LLILKSRDGVRLDPGISGLENFRNPGIRESRDPGIAIHTRHAPVPSSRCDITRLRVGTLLEDKISTFTNASCATFDLDLVVICLVDLLGVEMSRLVNICRPLRAT